MDGQDRTERIVRAFVDGCGGGVTEEQIVTAVMAFESEYARAKLSLAVYDLVLDGEVAFVIKDGECAFSKASEKKASRVRMKFGVNEMEAEGEAGAVTDVAESFAEMVAPAGRVKVPLANPDVLKCSRVGCQEYAIWRTFAPGKGSRSDRYRCAAHIGDVPDYEGSSEGHPSASVVTSSECSNLASPIPEPVEPPAPTPPPVATRRHDYPNQREPYDNGGNNQLKPERQEELLALLRDGRWSTNDIAAKMGISHVTVIRYRKIHEIEARNDRGGHWTHKVNRRPEITEEARKKLAAQGIRVDPHE